jgi:hypothetical protein
VLNYELPLTSEIEFAGSQFGGILTINWFKDHLEIWITPSLEYSIEGTRGKCQIVN